MYRYCAIILCAFLPLVVNQNAAAGKPRWVNLNDRNKMPGFGLGTWPNEADEPNKISFEERRDRTKNIRVESVNISVQHAIDAGYRHIDTSAVYRNEREIGEAVNIKINEGVVTRKDMFITTKLWNSEHAQADVLPALLQSLQNLNMSYVDLYLIEWPITTTPNGRMAHAKEIDYLETWYGMIEARKRGLTKSIGVSNFNEAFIQRLIHNTSVVPAVLQVEVNLNFQQTKLREFCRSKRIAVVACTPFGSDYQEKIYNIYRPLPQPPWRNTNDSVLISIAEKHGKSVAQIIMRYLYELNVIPIPKSFRQKRIEENIDIFDFKLSGRDKSQLRSFDCGWRTLNPYWWWNSTYYPFEKPELNDKYKHTFAL